MWLFLYVFMSLYLILDLITRIWFALIGPDTILPTIAFKSVHIPVILFQGGADLSFHFPLHSPAHHNLIHNEYQYNNDKNHSHDDINLSLVQIPVNKPPTLLRYIMLHLAYGLSNLTWLKPAEFLLVDEKHWISCYLLTDVILALFIKQYVIVDLSPWA